MLSWKTAGLALALCAWASSAEAGERVTQALAAPSTRFILQFGVLVLAAKLAGRLMHRWRMPRVLGEVGAGLLVGPHLLGGLALPLFPDGLMSDAGSLLQAQGASYGVMTVTLVVFFFLIGLDTDIQLIRRASLGGVAAGVGGFALCFAATLVVLVWAAPRLTGDQAWGWASPQALLVCTAVSVASVGMLARMLAQRQRMESPAGTVALTAALTDNALGLFLFAVFSGALAAVSEGARPGAYLLASMALRALAGFGVVALCGFPIARYVNGLALREKNYTSAFAVSAACLLIAGGVMGAMGLSVMAGAYVMGIAFSTTDMRHEIRERLDFVSVVLVPACFAALGMQIDPGLLGDSEMAASLSVFVGAVILSKAVGCALSASAAELNVVGCLRVGAASLSRGEISVALMCAAIGMGVLSSGVLFGVVLAVVITGAFGPFLAGCAFAVGGNGTRQNFVMPESVKIAFQFPSHQAAMLMLNRTLEIFEADGFYAHRLNRHQILYRISRESQVIHLQEREGEVTFDCSERERPLINTVMLELSSGVEQSLRELQKPLDDVLLRKNMQSSAAPSSSASVASAVLRNRFAVETLKPRLLATTKQGAISELVTLLYENGLVMDRERAVQAVFEREQSLSTGLEYGLAIPHARTDAVTRLVCAVGLKKEGMDFDSVDGKPVRIVVLVLAPDTAATPQLQLIAQLCRLLNEQGRAALLACDTPQDMFGVLAGGAAGSAASASGRLASPLASCLQWQSISLDLAAKDQEQAISLLLALCARSGAIGAVEEIRYKMQALSSLAPERIGQEAALFAIETPSVFRTVAALGLAPKGVTCACVGQSRVCAMVLYPPSAAEEVARVKEALVRALDGSGLDALMAAKTGHEALDILVR